MYTYMYMYMYMLWGKTALFQSKSVAFIHDHYFYPSSFPSAQDKTINWTNSQVRASMGQPFSVLGMPRISVPAIPTSLKE